MFEQKQFKGSFTFSNDKKINSRFYDGKILIHSALKSLAVAGGDALDIPLPCLITPQGGSLYLNAYLGIYFTT